jgi:hypothetical protein
LFQNQPPKGDVSWVHKRARAELHPRRRSKYPAVDGLLGFGKMIHEKPTDDVLLFDGP